MSARFARWAAAAFACVLASASAAAPLTEAEKQLLMSGMSAATATELGKSADAAALERIVAIGDPALVQAYGRGMSVARVDVMPAAIEALVVRHFNDPRVGAALRNLGPRYQTRALFDLHYAVAKSAYRSDDPVFEQILRTDQPGVDEPLLAIAPRFPARSGEVPPVAMFLARRKHPGAIAPMIAAMEASYAGGRPNSLPFSMLLGYDSPDTWRQASAELERLHAAGKVSEQAYAYSRTQIGAQLSDPEGYLARRRGVAMSEEFGKRREALKPPSDRSEPARYIEDQARYLEASEAIAAEYRDEGIDYQLARDYGQLGLHVRLQAGDPARAVSFLEKAAKGRNLIGQVALAETYQLVLRDKAQALRTYQLALDTANETGKRITPYARPGNAMHEFWKGWLAAEIEFLRSGKPFGGRVSEPEIAGFWEVMNVWARVATPYFPGWPWLQGPTAVSATPGYGPQAMGTARMQSTAPTDWASVAGTFATVDRQRLAAKLAAVPASRLSLLVTLPYVSILPDAEAILRELGRHDPSGYWSTLILGTIAFHESGGAERRDAALANGIAEMMPGMAAPGRPNALASAARKHLRAHGLRVAEKK